MSVSSLNSTFVLAFPLYFAHGSRIIGPFRDTPFIESQDPAALIPSHSIIADRGWVTIYTAPQGSHPLKFSSSAIDLRGPRRQGAIAPPYSFFIFAYSQFRLSYRSIEGHTGPTGCTSCQNSLSRMMASDVHPSLNLILSRFARPRCRW